MDRAEFVRRIVARSGLGFEEADRLLDVVLEEFCSATGGHRPLDLGDLGRLEPEPEAAGARFVPSRNYSAFGAHRRE
jgi:hypothetical protein